MQIKKKLLLIDKHQFGYLTDSYKWCQYLKEEYDITLICFDIQAKKIPTDDIDVKYVNSRMPKILRGIIYVLYTLFHIAFFKGKIMVVYFEGCSIYKKFFPKKKMLLDIRTLSISRDSNRRNNFNQILKETCLKYDVITAISEGVKNALSLPQEKVISILPLGADCISDEKKDYSTPHLLYVGTFNGRDIHKTVYGVIEYLKQNPTSQLTYDIIGDGANNELEYLQSICKERGVEDRIKLHGRKTYTELKAFFDTCNVGVSFVPMTDYYEYQPPTKTFEYVMSGLYTIATATAANKELINSTNGILIDDSTEDFTLALTQIANSVRDIKETDIRESLSKYQWSNIINKQLIPILDLL